MNYRKSFVFTFLSCMVLLAGAAYAENQVLGEVEINGASKVEKTSGVWVDGQYVGYVKELKGDRKLLLLPGTHTIIVRQSGYGDFTQSVTVEPGIKQVLDVKMGKDPRTHAPQSYLTGEA